MDGNPTDAGDCFAAYGIPTDCHPKIRRILEYWLSLHPAAGELPGRRHLDPNDIPDLLDSVALIDVARDPIRFRLRLVGTRIVDFRGCDGTGKWMDEALPGFAGTDSYRQYVEVAETGEPRWIYGQASVSRDRRRGNRERILLPLAADGQTVDMLLVLLLYRPETDNCSGRHRTLSITPR